MEDDLVNLVGEITATSEKIREGASEQVASDTERALGEVEVSASDERGLVEVTIAGSAVTRLALEPGWLAGTDPFEVERTIAATVNDCLAEYQKALAEAMQANSEGLGELFGSLKSLDARLDAAYDRAIKRIDAGEVLW